MEQTQRKLSKLKNRDKTKLILKNFSFIDSGRSHGKGSGTIAERHDEKLNKAFSP